MKMHARRHLRLEVLEDRAVPAALSLPNPLVQVSPPNPLVSDLQAQVATSQASLVSFASPTGAVGAFTPPPFEGATGPVVVLPSTVGSPPLFSPGLDSLGFPGRILFPGTGVQARSANGAGPLTQLPGLYLVGGSQSPAEDAATLRPSVRDVGAEAADGLAPDEAVGRPEGFEQATFLPR